jgi:hypothetical protein
VLKIKKKYALVLLVSILALAAIGTSVVSEADNVQTGENQAFNHIIDESNLFVDQHLLMVCDGSTCDMP